MSRKRRKCKQTLFMLDPTDAAGLLRERITSREWWSFVLVQRVGLSFMVDLERLHYSGKTNRDFEFMAIPFVAGLGIVGVGLARKSRLSVRQLAQRLDMAGMAREAETLAKHKSDVIVFTHSAELFQRMQVWLTQLVHGETERENERTIHTNRDARPRRG